MFEAGHASDCENCDRVIKPGEEIRLVSEYNRGGENLYAHVVCPEDPPAPEICPTCQMTLPASGRCGWC